MQKLLACGVVICTVAVPLLANGDRRLTFVELGSLANQKLNESYGTEGNNLLALPTGQQTFAGVKFKIGPGLIRLRGTDDQTSPEKADGLKVNTTFSKLYILHACHNGANDNAIIGYYTVHYENKSHETIPIVFGSDVLDWWYKADSKEPTRARVAWKGDNDDAKNQGAKIRLYLTTWKNPEPARKVVSVDFGSTNYTTAAPFCVAITAEE
jgi:hypothetical protein